MKKLFFLLLAVMTVSASVKAEIGDPNKKAIVFDFGGVIIECDKTVLANYIRELFKVDGEELLKVQQDFRAARRARIPEPVFWQRYATEHHLDLPAGFETQIENVKLSSLTEIKGMRELINFYKAKGYQVALLSNVGSSHAGFLRDRGYYDGFSPILLSCELGVDKPDPRIYQILLSRLQVAPENCIFIDDKKENVDAAIALGIDGIVFSSSEQIKAELERRLN